MYSQQSSCITAQTLIAFFGFSFSDGYRGITRVNPNEHLHRLGETSAVDKQYLTDIYLYSI